MQSQFFGLKLINYQIMNICPSFMDAPPWSIFILRAPVIAQDGSQVDTVIGLSEIH